MFESPAPSTLLLFSLQFHFSSSSSPSFYSSLVLLCSLSLLIIICLRAFCFPLVFPLPLSVSVRPVVLPFVTLAFLNVQKCSTSWEKNLEVVVWTCPMCNYAGSFVLVTWVASRCAVKLIIDVGAHRLGAWQGLLAWVSKMRKNRTNMLYAKDVRAFMWDLGFVGFNATESPCT